MNPPALLLGAGLLLWGWQTGLWIWAVGLAATLEGARLLRLRWEFSQSDLDRVWNLCVVLFMAAVVYALTSAEGSEALLSLARGGTAAARAEALRRGARPALLLFQWLPLTLFPMALVQVCSAQPQLDFSTFSWWLRRRRRQPGAPSAGRLNVGYAYFGVCVLAASATPARSAWFGVAVSLLLGWALWPGRSRSYGAGSWVASLGAALLLGLGFQVGLMRVQGLVPRLDDFLINRLGRRSAFDPRENRMQMGALDRLRRSGRILWRVKAEAGSPPPLLREASYDFFKWPFWAATTRDFGTVFDEDTNTHTRVLSPGALPECSAVVAGLLPQGKGLLPLPAGAVMLEGLPVFGLETNRLGAVRSMGGPGYLEFRVHYVTRPRTDTAPGPVDLEVPNVERPGLERVIRELGLVGQAPQEVIQRLSAWFAQQFQYSMRQPTPRVSPTNETALTRFLLRDRRGHCEYFATATVLLLRAVGIPARYAVGYAVQERKGSQWIVRDRHAHAWCLAWVDGAWQELDTTPGTWVHIENTQAGWWQAVSDLWSATWFAFSKFRWTKAGLRQYVVWLIGAVLVVAVGRLLWVKPWRKARTRATAPAGQLGPGLDSEFYLVERHLTELGFGRDRGETLSAWLARLEAGGRAEVQPLRPALALHYRLRFDPRGLKPDERAALRHAVSAWLRSAEANRWLRG